MEIEEGIRSKGVREDASAKNMGPRYRIKGGVHTEKEKGIFIVKGRKGRGANIRGGSIEERVHLSFQITPNVTSTLCGKKGWHMENGTRLSTCKLVDSKEWVPLTLHHRHIQWSRKEKGVHKAGPEVGIQ